MIFYVSGWNSWYQTLNKYSLPEIWFFQTDAYRTRMETDLFWDLSSNAGPAMTSNKTWVAFYTGPFMRALLSFGKEPSPCPEGYFVASQNPYPTGQQLTYNVKTNVCKSIASFMNWGTCDLLRWKRTTNGAHGHKPIAGLKFQWL